MTYTELAREIITNGISISKIVDNFECDVNNLESNLYKALIIAQNRLKPIPIKATQESTQKAEIACLTLELQTFLTKK